MALLAIVTGGALGTLARVALGSMVGAPWGTLVVNTAGATALGWLIARGDQAPPRYRRVFPLLATGFLGSFTTFSALAQELATIPLWHALGDGAVALGCGLAAAGLGWRWGSRG